MTFTFHEICRKQFTVEFKRNRRWKVVFFILFRSFQVHCVLLFALLFFVRKLYFLPDKKAWLSACSTDSFILCIRNRKHLLLFSQRNRAKSEMVFWLGDLRRVQQSGLDGVMKKQQKRKNNVYTFGDVVIFQLDTLNHWIVASEENFYDFNFQYYIRSLWMSRKIDTTNK